MPISRKLSPAQEREVALAYLCSVDVKSITETWNISEGTICRNIVGQRSLEWHDPLVEFYRQTAAREREWNAAHWYLAYNHQNVPQGDLVQKEPRTLQQYLHPQLSSEKVVYDAVWNTIFKPRIEKVVQNTALDVYITEQQSPLEKLLAAVLSPRNGEGVVEQVMQKGLMKYVVDKNHSSLNAVFQEVQQEIIEKIKYGALAITPQKAELIDEVLKTLSQDEQEILQLRFGLSGEKVKTFREMETRFDRSPERIRQMEAKALRELRHPNRAKTLKVAYDLVTDTDVDAYQRGIKEQEDRQRWKKKLYSEIEREVLRRAATNPRFYSRIESLRHQQSADYDAHSVEELELSVRSTNCLENAGIRTIGELRQRSEAELLKTKNFGRKSLKEIKYVLGGIGITLRKE